MVLKAIIVEDEAASRQTLMTCLSRYCPVVSVVAEAGDIREGLAAINKYQPDLVFLDIEMPYGNAFDLLEQIENITFETVFVTAFSNYAIKALNFSASYYILKPVDIDELVRAVGKIAETVAINKEFVHTKVLIDNLKLENKQLQKIVLPLIDGFEVARVKDIIRCEAEDNFTCFYFTSGKKQLICRTLKFYENLLSDFDFIRVHKSHLVNFQYIRQYKRGKGGQVIMEDGKAVDVSNERKKYLLEKFGSK